MNHKTLRQKYNQVIPLYERLKVRVTSDLMELIEGANIPTLNIQSRVKDFESFSAKCERKSYKEPFSQNEDLLGLRIVVYFPDDINKVIEIIDSEFDVKESENKLDGLNADQFGYRSVHKIVAIKDGWAASPGYRGLKDLKCEIQIRTVLMHTWAEIEHKLQYKSTAAVPKILRRKFSLLSAQLETADNQFQELQKEILLYKNSLPDTFSVDKSTLVKMELNIETLKRYLHSKYPDRMMDSIDTFHSLINELFEAGIWSFEELETILAETKSDFLKYESSIISKATPYEGVFTAAGLVRSCLKLYLHGPPG